MRKIIGAQGYAKNYKDAISRKEAREPKRQDMLATILNRTDEGKSTEKQRSALKTLMLEADIAEKQIEKSKADFQGDIRQHVSQKLANLDEELKSFKIKFNEQLKEAGRHLGMAKVLFESIGPKVFDRVNDVDEIAKKIQIQNV